MEALILSCSTGGGHDSAARAVKDELLSRGHNAVMLDPYTLDPTWKAAHIGSFYVFTAKYFPYAFGAAYHLGMHLSRLPITSPMYLANRKAARKLGEYLKENRYDVIAMTHFYAAEMVTYLRRKGYDLPPMVFIGTDYTCTPFTMETQCDKYVIPAEDLCDDYIKQGATREQLLPYGIPVSRVFEPEETDIAALRGQLGLHPDKQCVLATGGSMGAGNMKRLTAKLIRYGKENSDTQFVIICGTNKKLQKALTDKTAGNDQFSIIGFTDRMNDYMAAADVFITKPGGLSSTEAAVTGLPMIHMSSIPGCETKNLRYFESRGMSLPLKHISIEKALDRLKNKQERTNMINNQRRYVSSSVCRICDLLEQMAENRIRIKRYYDMNIQIFGKSKCFDTKKAERYFKERGIKFQFIDILSKGMSKGEFNSISVAVGGYENLIDTSSKAYKDSTMQYLAYEKDKIEKLLETPAMFKTPVVRNGRQATVGYQPDVWKKWE